MAKSFRGARTKMPMFAVNDGTDFQMHYEVSKGAVPTTTLFLHGNCASGRWWYPAEEIWKRQAKNRRYAGSLIFTDFRGCGKSSTPKKMSEIDMHRFADDQLELLSSLNEGRVNLVAHSTGGLVAALMMAKAPHFFEKAVLLDPVGATGVRFDKSMVQAFEAMKTDKELVATVLGSTIHNNDVRSDFFRQIVVKDAFRCVKSIGCQVLQALDGLDVRKEVANISNEVLVLHGEFDNLLSLDASKALANLIPKAEFRVIKGQGHCWNVENPAAFVGTINEFLFQGPRF